MRQLGSRRTHRDGCTRRNERGFFARLACELATDRAGNAWAIVALTAFW